MHGGQNTDAAAGCHQQSPVILSGAHFIYTDHIRSHGTDQHHNTFFLGTALQHIRTDTHIILRYTHVAAR